MQGACEREIIIRVWKSYEGIFGVHLGFVDAAHSPLAWVFEAAPNTLATTDLLKVGYARMFGIEYQPVVEGLIALKRRVAGHL